MHDDDDGDDDDGKVNDCGEKDIDVCWYSCFCFSSWSDSPLDFSFFSIFAKQYSIQIYYFTTFYHVINIGHLFIDFSFYYFFVMYDQLFVYAFLNICAFILSFWFCAKLTADFILISFKKR